MNPTDTTGERPDRQSDRDETAPDEGNPDGNAPDRVSPDWTDPERSAPDWSGPDEVRRAIRDRAGEIERQERSHAFDRLETRGELTARQRRVIGDLAAGIVDGILAGPESALAAAPEADCETVRTAAALFDPERGDGE
jgi:hypothetical protein